jgi:predicted double-glycine peptidase
MSTIVLTEQGTPATPTTNKVRLFVNNTGNLCSVDDSGTVTVYAAGVTPEEVQDIIGGILTDTASIDLVYDDAADQIRANVLPAGVNHDALQNFVANEHIDHSSVSISAGTGLTGGGDITANRTISMPNVGTAGTYQSVTTDAQGRVTAGTNPTTLAGFGITDAQPLDADLTAVAGLAGTGLVTRTGAGTATTRSVAAGTGLSVANGDGVSGNPTLAIANTITAGSAGSATQVPAVTYNAQGQLTAVTPTTIAIPSTAVTDFAEAVDDRVAALVVAGTGITATYNDPANTLTLATTITQYTDELAQDAVGGILTDTASVDFTYNDAANTISAAVLPAGVNHNVLQNYVANEHINHSTVSITAGTGLTGGGDLTTTRTLNLSNVGTAGTYQSVTTDAQGRVTAGTNPTTLAGFGITDAQPLDSDLTALAGLAGTGLIVRTGTGTAITRTLAAGAGISLSNADGVSGNPTITSTITQYTDELAQDAVGTILTDTASVDFTYNDVANTITAAVLPAGVNHDALQNFVANEHINHSSVVLTAGVGLSGGGDITASRTIDLEDTAVTPGTYGSASVYPVITVDQQGRLTNVTTQAVPGGALTARNDTVLTNSSNVTLTAIPDMTLTLAANTTYKIEGFFIHSSAATTTGIGLVFNGGTVTPTSTRGYVETSTSATATNRLNFVAHTTVSVFASSAVVNQDQLTNFEMVVVTGGTGGTFIPQFRSENNGTTITLRANCFIKAEVI